jgi:putative PIG3 family NAD(P)H quinone oxidoreductase
MKAVVLGSYGAADVLRLDEISVPAPGVGQVLIRVAAAGVNRPDIIQRQGHYPPPAGESEILGLECAGTVNEAGPGVTDLSVGDRVFALVGGGAYAEFTVADAAHCLPIPAGLSFVQAACIAETFITAWLNLFLNAQLADGESVLLHGGGGGVNTAAIALTDALCPASRIIVTASPSKIERVAALGANHVIDYQAQDFASETRRLTDQRGVDVILDHIGAAYFEKNLAALATNGRLVIIGIMQGSDAQISLGRLMVKRQRIIGSVLRPRPAAEKAEIIAGFARSVMPLFEQGRIVPLVDNVYPLERAADAHRRMEASEHFGNIVLAMEKD